MKNGNELDVIKLADQYNDNGLNPVNPIKIECKNGRLELYGLTKREYFAGLAMQGMLADPNASNFKPKFIAELAVDFSDALLEELDKK